MTRLANVTPWVRDELRRFGLPTPVVTEDVAVYLSARSAHGPWTAVVTAPERADEGFMHSVEVDRRTERDLGRLLEELVL